MADTKPKSRTEKYTMMRIRKDLYLESAGLAQLESRTHTNMVNVLLAEAIERKRSQ